MKKPHINFQLQISGGRNSSTLFIYCMCRLYESVKIQLFCTAKFAKTVWFINVIQNFFANANEKIILIVRIIKTSS